MPNGPSAADHPNRNQTTARLRTRRAQRPPGAFSRFGRVLRRHWIGILLGCVGLGLLGGGGTFWYLSRDLPPFDSLTDYRPLIATRIFGPDGTEVFQFSRERRTVVRFEEIPTVMRQAVLAAEDSPFYQHEGVNYLAIAKCVARGVFRGRVTCGGSTITQQVVKTFLLSSRREISRKVKEVILARRLEKNLSKDEILYLYLNQIYFGHRRYGVEEASRFYFGKSVREINLGEAAMIAGVIQSPERLSPVKHPVEAKNRQKYVLRRMAQENYISQKVAAEEMERPILVASHPDDPPGAWYADAVRKYLDAKYGAERVETDGLMVDIAMDPFMQKIAEKTLVDDLRAIDRRQGWRGATHSLDARQLAAAMPLWRDRLKAMAPKPREVLVWDLARVSTDDIEPGTESEVEIQKMARVRVLDTEEMYNGLVVAVTAKEATIDLGGAKGVIALSDASWARKWSPRSWTAAPRSMEDVVEPNDIVLVRVMSGKPSPVEAARQGKPLRLALEQMPKVQGALVAIDPVTRGVRALVGGHDYGLSQFNRAIQARRQPGSAFKPFVWGAAIESRRFTPATVVYDTPDLYRDPQTGREWKPQNYERETYEGPMLLKEALALSKNTVSVKLADTLGIDSVISFAKRAGITTELPSTLSLALGTGEVLPIDLVNAYATIAAQGFHTEPVLVLRVRNREGKVLEEHVPAQAPVPAAPVDSVPENAAAAETEEGEAFVEPATLPPTPRDGIEPAVAFVLSSMMRGVIDHGTGIAARALERPAAGKTGTTSEHKDAWFVGFTPSLVAGVWVGFDQPTVDPPLGPGETGARAALPAWLRFMQATVGGKPAVEFQAPGNVEFARIDPETGLLARENPLPGAGGVLKQTPFVAFVAGTAPIESAPDPNVSGTAPQSFFEDDH